MSFIERISLPDRQLSIILVGGTINQRALICHTASGEALHIDPVTAIDELGARDLMGTDVFIAWDEGETIPELKRHLSAAGCWAPIVAICTVPTARQVVRAINAGAMDFIEWPCDIASLRISVKAAYERNAQLLPQRERQIAARSALQKLSPREQQVLAALSEGMTNKEIGKALEISPRTVEIHRANFMGKLQAKHSADAIRLALEASMPVSWSLGDNSSADPSSADGRGKRTTPRDLEEGRPYGGATISPAQPVFAADNHDQVPPRLFAF